MSFAMFCPTHGAQYSAPCPSCKVAGVEQWHEDPATPPARAVTIEQVEESWHPPMSDAEAEIIRRRDDLHAALVREANAPRTEQWAACVRSLLLYGRHADDCPKSDSNPDAECAGVVCTCGFDANRSAAGALLKRA